MDDKELDPERRSWEDAETASAELPTQLRVLQRMIAAAKAQLEEISERVAMSDAANDRNARPEDSPGPDRL
jgi:hypothetical protein